MFTGIVEEIGVVEKLRRGQNSIKLSIAAATVLSGAKIGDSIAVNGVCLTLTSLLADSFSADVMPETLARTALAQLAPGSQVNLERALPANGRFGGHLVSGHIDGLGRITRISPDDNAVWYTIQAAPELMRYIVEKGSIAINGISLTVAAVTETSFSVAIIPHTLHNTTLSQYREGDRLNLETDLIGKYLEKLLRPPASSPGSSPITIDLLAGCGFLDSTSHNPKE